MKEIIGYIGFKWEAFIQRQIHTHDSLYGRNIDNRSFAPFDPYDQETGPQLSPPNKIHLMGTDNLQRDVWSRMVFGSKTILRVAVLAAVISSVFGITFGLISGFIGGFFDRILSLVMDSVYSFPGLILAIAFAAMLGPGVINITLAVNIHTSYPVEHGIFVFHTAYR